MTFSALLRTAAGLLLLLFVAQSAQAVERRPYDDAAFASAQQRGAPILVEVTAPWCPTCRAQKPIIEKLAAQPANKDLVIFSVDYDSQKVAVRKFEARSQSTLVAFRGAAETARSVGDTAEASIAGLIASTVKR